MVALKEYVTEAEAKLAAETLLRFAERIPVDEPLREGLLETPNRLIKGYKEWFSGYDADVDAVAKSFKDGAEKVRTQEMVIVRDLPIYSHCEHHVASISGIVHIGYIPNGTILGLSKFKRIADIFARRLQVQERLTSQIAETLEAALEPRGVAVVVEARHMCMESRGVNTPGSLTQTTALRGVFEQQAVRDEFFQHLARRR